LRMRLIIANLIVFSLLLAAHTLAAIEQAHRMTKRLKEDGVSILLSTHEFHSIAHLSDTHLSLQPGSLYPQFTDRENNDRKIIPLQAQ